MAKKKTRTKSGGIGSSIMRGLAAIWRGLAKFLGKSIRFVAKGAKDLDPAHQRDGFAFLLLILALMAAAGTWFDGGNVVGRALASFFYGGFGRMGVFTPLVLGYFAFRFFHSPQEKAATGRIVVGAIALLLSTTGIAHLLNAAPGTGTTAMHEGGGWLGYGISQPLVALMTDVLAYPVLILLFCFGLLVTTATPVSSVITRIKNTATWLNSKRPDRSEEEFEITDTPPFETPVVADWNKQQEEEELDEESFDEEFTVEVPVAIVTPPTATPNSAFAVRSTAHRPSTRRRSWTAAPCASTRPARPGTTWRWTRRSATRVSRRATSPTSAPA